MHSILSQSYSLILTWIAPVSAQDSISLITPISAWSALEFFRWLGHRVWKEFCPKPPVPRKALLQTPTPFAIMARGAD
jgi:hypothetical protein